MTGQEFRPESRAQPPGVGQGDLASNDVEDDDEPSNLCCVGGCVAGSAVTFLFILVLPAGILMAFYGSNNRDTEVLVVGIILVAIPIASIPILVIIIINRRRIRKFRKRRVSEGNVIPAPEVVKY